MRVLAADDDEVMRMLIGALLEQAGHTVTIVNDGTEAWCVWERERHQIVVLDWMMPGIDGITLCRRIREADPDRTTFVLVVTAKDKSEDLTQVLDAGADDYVSKPLTPSNFLTRLRIAERHWDIDNARRRAERELVEARYLAGIGETAIALQHEINNPLAALMSTVGLIDQGLYKPEEMPEALGTISEQAKRIAGVLKRLSQITNPRSVEYAFGERMLDLSPEGDAAPPPSS
ncbi:MAG: response regulator [Gemmatimonadetes bacterium]|nr:response regulator [Gemmatimonadota bacterium]